MRHQSDEGMGLHLAGRCVEIDIFQWRLYIYWCSCCKGLDTSCAMVVSVLPQLLLLHIEGFCSNVSCWVAVEVSFLYGESNSI